MATVYISEAELSRNLHAADLHTASPQARSGADVVVEMGDMPVVVRASGWLWTFKDGPG